MNKDYRHIGLWLCSMLMLLCTACSSSDGDSEDDTPKAHQLQLNIYTPEHPVVTRAEMVNSNDDENVNNMDIWVFASEASEHFPVGTLVGYVHVDISSPSSFEGGTYQMSVSEDFVNEHPNVDVYVAANVKNANTGLSLTNNSLVSYLKDEAKLVEGQGCFGLATPTSTPPLEGLPMSGVLKNKEINISRTPLLSVDDPVKVVRAVSKVRFIFSRTDSDFGSAEELHINSIMLNNEMIPQEEYLFLNGAYDDPLISKFRTGGTYLADEKTLASGLETTAIPTCTYPARYAYDPNKEGQLSGQAYEDLINQGLRGHFIEGDYTEGQPYELAELRCFYFRESDKQLRGKIYYTIGNGGEGWPKYSEFVMTNGENFARNHTWIVFGYFAGKETLKVTSVDVTDWNQTTNSHPVYNW